MFCCSKRRLVAGITLVLITFLLTIKFAFAQAEGISGVVTDQAGKPLENIRVSVLTLPSQGWPFIDEVGTAITDVNGTYRVAIMGFGTYRVRFEDTRSPQQYATEYYNDKPHIDVGTDVVVSFNTTTTNINAQLAIGGKITGKVTDPANQPLANVFIREYRNVAGVWRSVQSTQSTADGTYTLGGLPADTYRLIFFGEGNHATEYYNNKETLALATGIPVAVGATVPNINVQLAPRGHITGKVTDNNNNMLAGIAVTAYRYDDSRGEWYAPTSTTTDAAGTYDLAQMDTGTYRLHFQDTRSPQLYQAIYYKDATNVDTATDVKVGIGATVANLNIKLATKGKISGTVTDLQGQPILNAGIGADIKNPESGQWSRVLSTGYTNAAGAYELNGLDAGTYRVNFGAAQYRSEFYNNTYNFEQATELSVNNNQGITNINAQLMPTSRITGMVTDQTGTPLENIQVTLYQFVTDGFGSGYWRTFDLSYLQTYIPTNAAGMYAITGVEPGIYRIGFADGRSPREYASEYYNNAAAIESGTDIVVPENGVVNNINAQLAPTGRIMGKVTDTNGIPIDRIEVTLQRYELHDSGGYIWNYITSIQTGNDGLYTFLGLTPGTYRIHFADSDNRYFGEYYDNAESQDGAKDIIIGENSIISGIDAQLANTGHITGTVTDGANQPVRGAVVEAYRKEENGSSEWQSKRLAATNTDGSYDIAGLLPGQYRIEFRWADGFAQPAPAFFATEYYNNSPTFDDATEISVGKSQIVTGIDAQVEPPAQISGRVTGQNNGNPLPNILVRAFAEYSTGTETYWNPIVDATTDDNGNYSLKLLSAGHYRILFIENSELLNYVAEFYNNVFTLEKATEISVIGGQTVTGIDAQLLTPSHIVGTVRDEKGNPLPNIQVSAQGYYSATVSRSEWRVARSAVTDEQGKYDLPGLAPLGYRVSFNLAQYNNDSRYLGEYYNDVIDFTQAQTILVPPQDTVPNIDAQLVPYSHITGKVTDEAGNNLDGINARAYYRAVDQEGNTFWNAVGSDPTPVVEGIYDIVLPAGIYRVTFWDQMAAAPRYRTEYYDNAAYVEMATDIVVAVNSTVPNIDIKLIPAGTGNFAPYARNDKLTVIRGEQQNYLDNSGSSVLDNDREPEEQALTALLISPPMHGTITLNAEGTFIYTHNGDEARQDFFTYRATDGINNSNIATVTVTINLPVSFVFSKTVGIDGITPACTATNAMKVPVGTVVAYCYTIKNIGAVALTNHTLVDSHLGTILNNEHIHLTPGLSHTEIVTQALSVSTTNIATWTATVDGTVDAALLAGTEGGNIRSQTAATVNISAPTDDQDGDTIPDNVEGAGDPDHDNLPNFLDTNSDGDSVTDQAERGSDPTRPLDSDNDGIADFLEADKSVTPPAGAFLPFIRR